jgi:hypothetical protein
MGAKYVSKLLVRDFRAPAILLNFEYGYISHFFLAVKEIKA